MTTNRGPVKGINRSGQLWLCLIIATGLLAPALHAQSVNLAFTGSIQSYTISISGTYQITMTGGQGGSSGKTVLGNFQKINGGNGSLVTGYVYLTVGTVLDIAVGGQGAIAGDDPGVGAPLYFGAGGGGGSFVYTSAGTLLLAAGGGGGASTEGPGQAGLTTGGSGQGGQGSAGSGGNGGGGGGAGFFSSGTSGTGNEAGSGGLGSFSFAGGGSGYSDSDGNGGFGGGGGGGTADAGGGGGYSGGVGGTAGGGGSSYADASLSNVTMTGGENTGNGSVDLVLESVPEPPAWALLAIGTATAGGIAWRRRHSKPAKSEIPG